MATFGRGFYVLDDYSPLRATTAATVANAATLYPVRDAMLYVQTQQYGGAGNAFQGEVLYSANNPPYGAVITWYMKDGLKTLKEKRVEAEKAAEKAGKPIQYPTADQLRAEEEEEPPAVLVTIIDASGREVRTVTGPVGKGMQRVSWDLRGTGASIPLGAAGGGRGGGGGGGGGAGRGGGPPGPYVVPGKYSATLSTRVQGVEKQIAGPVTFNVVGDPANPVTLADQQARWEFQHKAMALGRQVNGAIDVANLNNTKLDQMRRALDATPNAPKGLRDQVVAYDKRLSAILFALRGDVVLGARSDPDPMSIQQRAGAAGAFGSWLGRPTGAMEEQYAIASTLFGSELPKLRQLVETDIPALERELERIGAPYTSGRLPGPP